MLVQSANKLLRCLPDGQPFVGCRVPVVRHLAAGDKPHFSGPCRDDASFDKPVDCSVFGAGKIFRHAELALVHSMLLEPRYRPTRIAIQLAFLRRQVRIEFLVDDLKCCPDRHR